jgi:hypothetical protein
MPAPTDVPDRRVLSGTDVMFLLSLAVVFFALVVTIVVIRH